MFKGLKDYGKKLSNLELFTESLEDWVLETSCADSANEGQCFSSPFLVDELHKLDLALEGVLFQQLYRMPCTRSLADELNEDEYLALEDFLHVVANGLWRTFWHKTGPFPFFVSCSRHHGLKFNNVEKSISREKLKEVCGIALMSKPVGEVQVRWDTWAYHLIAFLSSYIN